MKLVNKKFLPAFLAFLALIIFLFSGCNKKNTLINTPHKYPMVYNELGKILVAEYHRIENKDGDWIRTPEKFRQDLQRFYDEGYYLISVNDFFNKEYVKVPAGKKPLIITFDDGHPSQFRWLIKNGTTVEGKDGFPKVDPNCAVGILDDFCEKHPDFGKSATFFLNSTIFYQEECPTLWKEKLKYLVKTGREIGNHTFNHDDLSKLDYNEIKKTLALQQAKIEEALPGYMASSVALPFGILPKKGKWLLQRGEYKGKNYNYKVAFLVGSEPTLPPYHRNFDPILVQRVQANDKELNKWLTKIKNNPNDYFISDGDPNSISIQEKDIDLLDTTQLPETATIKVCSNEMILREFEAPSKKNRQKHIKSSQKGVYYTFYSGGLSKKIDALIENYKLCGLNTLIVDIKDIEGTVGVSIEAKKARNLGALEKIYITDFKQLVDKLHKNGIIVSGRIAVFKDRFLAKKRPDLALKKKNGNIHIENDGINWVNPFSEEVWDYNIEIAEAAIKCGVDEVQFDYIRFPEKSNPDDIFVPQFKSKYDAIEGFLKRAREKLNKYDVSIAIDVFGVMAWEKERDLEIIGQRIWELAKYADVVCPMLYPSHFDSGFDGHKDPANDPYLFMKRGIEKTKKLIEVKDTKILPWIQGFEWRVKNFNEQYILDQIRAVNECGLKDFLVWNAGNNYTTTFNALKKLPK